MIENKLYYQDPYLKTFKARVVKQERDLDDHWYVVLSVTAFYPTGGGQPCDLGTIDGQRVVNVEEVDGEIRHYLEQPLTESKGEVHGEIDWDLRFDHMQQHAGQHILSAAFDHLFQYKTIGFHLGNEILTIDLDTDHITEEDAQKAEAAANEMIVANRPIHVKWVTEEELSRYSLRKETKVKEDIRLVIIPDFDYNGCGGTHPNATGQVQSIKILGWEKQKKKIRLQFVCGNRVNKQLGQKQKVMQELTRLLNSPEHEMDKAVVRLIQQRKILEKSLEDAKERLLKYEASELLARMTESQVISELFTNRTLQELQKLARDVTTENPDVMTLFVAVNEGQMQLVCARGSSRDEDMKAAITNAIQLIDGKGGGSVFFAQGGGKAIISGEEMLAFLLKETGASCSCQ
jgi:alanyl-tRNA synthetase